MISDNILSIPDCIHDFAKLIIDMTQIEQQEAQGP